MKPRIVKLKNIVVGGSGPIILIAGPCVIESRAQALKSAEQIIKITAKLKIPFIFKSSYDKANRTGIDSFRGPGIVRGLKVLAEIGETFRVPVCSDIHSVDDVSSAKDVLDVIQIPALLSRQTDILLAAGRSGRVVNIKKGQFMAPWDIEHAVRKIEKTGNRKILITERGTCFGYNNLVTDMRSIAHMRELGYPVIFDASHSVQLPGGANGRSGGERKYIPVLARAAAACGCDGIFMEVHLSPDRALCDGPNMWPINRLESLLMSLKDIDEIVKAAAS